VGEKVFVCGGKKFVCGGKSLFRGKDATCPVLFAFFIQSPKRILKKSLGETSYELSLAIQCPRNFRLWVPPPPPNTQQKKERQTDSP
jgi:hypothetical protein